MAMTPEEIVKRLRARLWVVDGTDARLDKDAADMIEQLQRRVDNVDDYGDIAARLQRLIDDNNLAGAETMRAALTEITAERFKCQSLRSDLARMRQALADLLEYAVTPIPPMNSVNTAAVIADRINRRAVAIVGAVHLTRENTCSEQDESA